MSSEIHRSEAADTPLSPSKCEKEMIVVTQKQIEPPIGTTILLTG